MSTLRTLKSKFDLILSGIVLIFSGFFHYHTYMNSMYIVEKSLDPAANIGMKDYQYVNISSLISFSLISIGWYLFFKTLKNMKKD